MLTSVTRPRTLSGIIGIDKIKTEIAEHFRNRPNTLPEVIILSGPTGTGKTSLAYLLAAMLSNPSGINYDEAGLPFPDLEDPVTKMMFEDRFGGSVYFYDASAMSKDDVLGIEQSVATQPLHGRNNVVIIDEAQELSKGGRGSVLKLLEKQRKRTYLILCTMNLDSFDRAVKDRAQVYNFQALSKQVLSEHLFNLIEKQNLQVDDSFFDKGIHVIADAARGSVRAAVQYLETCVNRKLWTEADITRELDVTFADESLAKLLHALMTLDARAVTEIKTEPKEFAFRSSAILTDALLFAVTGDVDQQWKQPQFEAYVATQQLIPFVQLINSLCERPYLRDNQLKSELLLFILARRGSQKPTVPQRV